MKTLYERERDEDEYDDSFPGEEDSDVESSEYDEDDSFPGEEDDQLEEYEDESEDDDQYGDEESDEDDSFPDDDDDQHGDEESDEDDDKLDQVVDKATENPDRQGHIRYVPSAHLVYKRESPDGTFEELWIYNVDDMQKGIAIRKAILAGTDIDTNKTSSESDEQHYTVWSVGNGECLNIKGLKQ